MSFLPQYEYDAFVSYAHVDNQPFVGMDDGWVTTFIDNLKKLLAQKIGRKEHFKVWKDEKLVGHREITPDITQAVKTSGTLIAVMSPGYLASKWCCSEKEKFLDSVGKMGSRVFPVWRDDIPREEVPEEFRDLLGYKFWVRDEDEGPVYTLGTLKEDLLTRPYWDVLNQLAHELVHEWKRIRHEESGEPKREGDESPIVFLAESTDDLESVRNEVKRHLSQEGIKVLPDKWVSPDPGTFPRTVEDYVRQAELFVQLMSDIPGKRPPGLPRGYQMAQYEIAKNLEVPILQWRRMDLDIDAIKDDIQRDLLNTPTVMAVGLEEFKREVVRKAKEKKHKNGVDYSDRNVFVFVNSEKGDMHIAEEVCAKLRDYNVDFGIRLNEGEPQDLRSDLEENLINCDLLIIIYGEITARWVRQQLAYVRKINHKRKVPLKSLAVYEGPPDPKDPINYQLQNMQTLDCRHGLNEEELRRFLNGLNGGQ